MISSLYSPARSEAVDQRHAHGLALRMPERQAVTTGELRKLSGRADKLVDHLALGDFDAAQADGKAQLFGVDPHFDVADANLTGKRVVAAVTALGRVAQRQQKTLVATGQGLQALGAAGRVFQRVAGDVGDAGVVVGFVLDQAFFGKQTEHPWAGVNLRVRRGLRAWVLTFGQQRKIQQAVGVVEGRAEQLAAGRP